jgi:hypothetical protein
MLSKKTVAKRTHYNEMDTYNKAMSESPITDPLYGRQFDKF